MLSNKLCSVQTNISSVKWGSTSRSMKRRAWKQSKVSPPVKLQSWPKLLGTLGYFWKHFKIYFRPPFPQLNVDFGLNGYTVNGRAFFQHCSGGRGGTKNVGLVLIGGRGSVTRVNSSLVSQVILAKIVVPRTCKSCLIIATCLSFLHV